MAKRNDDTQRKNLDSFRKDRRAQRGTPMGYRSQAAQHLEVEGDDEAPWLGVPPFVTQAPIDYTTGLELSGEQQDLESIEVRQRRVLNLWVVYRPIAVAKLVVILQCARPGIDETNQFWSPVAVIDATLSFPGGIRAVRQFYASELETAFVGAGTHEVAIPFDVSPYRAVRFGVYEVLQEPPPAPPFPFGTLDLKVDLNV